MTAQPLGLATARLIGLYLSIIFVAFPLPALAQGAAEALSFNQLIERAPLIVVATATSRRAGWELYGSSRLIITTITFQVEQTLKGSAPRTLSVEVLGGTIGDETLHVSHVPEFKVGDRDVLFLNNAAHSVSPIVGSDQGRFRIVTESATGTPRVLTAGFLPLVSTADIGRGRPGIIPSMSAALSLDNFVTMVRDRARELAVR
ncbi:MAG: hypothetical protein ABI665_01785 [Vicinamibacterales bacterium]